MLPFHRILFPVDYSDPCQAVIPYVQEMACHFSAELTVCHAYAPIAVLAENEVLVADPELQAKAHAMQEDRLRQFACRNFAGQRLEAVAQLGDPGSVIDRVAEAQRADLVMLATRGHGPLRRLLLGSVTAKVLHDVSAAVWTGVGATLADHPPQIPYKSIVCALDDSQEAEIVLRASASLAAAYRAQLRIVHVLPMPAPFPEMNLAEYSEELRDSYLCRLRDLQAKLGVDAPHSVVEGALGEGVHDEVVRARADLLITGRGHSIGTFSRLWSHLYSIIRDSRCPVLSV